MKITAKKYAQAFFEATKDKSGEEIKKAISRLVNILFENKDLDKAEAVIKYFVKTWNKNKGITVVDVVTAEKTDNEMIEMLNMYITKMFNAKDVEIRSRIDKGIIGGVIIKHGDKIYDGSLKSRLYSLKEKIIK